VDVRRCLAAAALAAALAVAGRDARADPAADLEKAHDAYVARQYDDAEARLRTLLDPKLGSLKDPDNIADGRMYLGAVLVAEGKKDDAAKVFDSLLVDKPDYAPDPFRVAKEALDAFRDEQARHREQIAAAQQEKVRKEQEEKAKVEAARQKEALRIKMLMQLAGEETVVQENSRWKALIPFGVGQFSNGQTGLGWMFLVSESVFAAGSLLGGSLMLYNSIQQNNASSSGESGLAEAYNNRANSWFIAGNVLFGLFAATAIGGVLHAELTYVPERVTTRKRELPLGDASRLTLTLSPLVGPTGLGIQGRF
jgi:hypothetical protein